MVKACNEFGSLGPKLPETNISLTFNVFQLRHPISLCCARPQGGWVQADTGQDAAYTSDQPSSDIALISDKSTNP